MLSKKLLIGLAVGGVTLLVIGLVTRFVYPVIYDKEAALDDGTPVYNEWQAPDYPIYMKFYMYNYNNAEELMSDPTAKANVSTVGVLSYREYQTKFDIEYTEDSKKVLYYNNKSYVFDPDTSTMDEDEVIVVPNILMFTILETTGSIPFVGKLVKNRINDCFNSPDTNTSNAAYPFYMVEAADYLWGLYPNPLLENLQSLIPTLPTTFGLQLNNTNDGLYEIFTGKGDSNKNRGNVEKWNNATTLHYWATPSCNEINGTDGTIYPVNIQEDERLYIFNTQICRSIFIQAEKEEKVGGVHTTKFVAPYEVFEVDFEDNVGFCTDGKKSNCLGNGLLDVSHCYQELLQQQMGASLSISLIISSPEFLYCDNSTIDSIIGFSPNQNQHETFINMERNSGVILKAAKRVQINTIVKYFAGVDPLKQLTSSWSYLVPLFWGEESLPVDDSLIHLVNQSNRVTTAVLVLSYLFIAIGCILMAVPAGLVVYASTKKKYQYDIDNDRLLGKQF